MNLNRPACYLQPSQVTMNQRFKGIYAAEPWIFSATFEENAGCESHWASKKNLERILVHGGVV